MSKVFISRFISKKTAGSVLLPSATRLVQPSNPYCTSILRKRSSSSYGQILQSRYFSHSPSWKKKKDKGKTGTETKAVSATSKAPEDPSDLSQLEDGIADALSQFKNDLSKLRAGGRFNPESIENLRVAITKDRNETVRLGDVAQVVPKGGRTLTLLVNDEDLVKPVNSAIVASNLSLTPQQDSQNPLQLNIPIPPPTKESREQTSKAAKSAMEKAIAAVRSSRSVLHKRLQDMQKKKEARPDDVRKAHDQMEKLAEKGQKEMKDAYDLARKALD